MKLLILVIISMFAAVLSSCTDSVATGVEATDRAPENGAQFEKGKGLSITDGMAQAIGLKTVEVEERTIAARVPLRLRPLPGGIEAVGWLPVDQLEKLSPGNQVEFASISGLKGSIKSIEKPVIAGPGDCEIAVSFTSIVPENNELDGEVLIGESEAAVTIPRSALLSTAEGDFVYAVNGKHYFRTAVTVGVMNPEHVEITEGLCAGDAVVTSPVMSLWMAELQVLRGGKACTCGH